MAVDHHELRAAFGRFLEAKRALRHAYRRSLASHPAGSAQVLERRPSGQAGDDPATIEDIQELRDENETLRKSLTLLHAHSLRIQDRLDALLERGNKPRDARETVACRVPEGPPEDGSSRPSVGPLDVALCESTDEPEPGGWTIVTVSAGMTG